MQILHRARVALRRRLALRRSAMLAREAAQVLRERNSAPLCSMHRMSLTARAMELSCLSSAAAAEAIGDPEMELEHRVEAKWFARSARLRSMLGAPT